MNQPLQEDELKQFIRDYINIEYGDKMFMGMQEIQTKEFKKSDRHFTFDNF